jgi:phage gp36-like protein
MAYSKVQDVRLILSGFSDPGLQDDPDYTPAMLGDAQIEWAIRDADSQIDSVVRRIYAVPLPDPVPDIIVSLSTDMAAVLSDNMWRGSREYATELSPARLLWDRCTRILNSVGSGAFPLYNVGEGPDQVGNESIVINPYDGDILLDRDVYPKGNSPDVMAGGDGRAQYATVPIPYHPPLN